MEATTNPTPNTEAHVVATLTKFWALPMSCAKESQLRRTRNEVLTIMGHAIRRDWATAERTCDDILKAISGELKARNATDRKF